MRWICRCCGKTTTTTSLKSKPLISGCPATKDRKHNWVPA